MYYFCLPNVIDDWLATEMDIELIGCSLITYPFLGL
jgi:hypothetical protein